ncbi:MAG TPA: hypothetical protein VHC49_09365 [Mycobacteriales bacterium]|nr:hypothetical protein [Mycobacteriales bacterium]
MNSEGEFVTDGAGDPVTLFAAGGVGAGNFDWARSWSAGMGGTRAFFKYGEVGPWLPGKPPRREAERDAAEARAVADQSGATCAVGVSRGARALVGSLADDPARFDRVALVIPPGGTAAGRYREWLLDRPPRASAPITDLLILAMRGDQGHPVRIAEDWAARLGAQLEVLPSAFRQPDVIDAMGTRCGEFLRQGQ